jgi:hypothetical protein
MAAVRGNVIAFLLFAASFALHIVGGAMDQGWLFAVAVALIAVCAAGFPVIAVAFSGASSGSERALTAAIGGAAGAALTASALWAAEGRAWAWWHIPLALAIALAATAVALRGGIVRPGRGSPSHG